MNLSQKISSLLILVLIFPCVSNSQEVSLLHSAFESASKEFSVPVEILKGIAFVESRWTQIQPDPDSSSANCTGMPPAYGVMGLRDDEYFGHSLVEAAQLIHRSPEELKHNPAENIRGAAALLKKLAATHLKKAGPQLESWNDVVAAYSGIPQQAIALLYAQDVYRVLASGWHSERIDIEPHTIQMDLNSDSLIRAMGGEPLPPSLLSDDYPPAVWDPSPNFNPGRGEAITRVIIHDTEGSFASALSWLKNPQARASAHYIIRSFDGYIVQLVRERDKAWHVRCWNPFTIGIEHEGYVDKPSYFTDVMYRSSAALTRSITRKYGIPQDLYHIIGHGVWTQRSIWSVIRHDQDFARYDPTSTDDSSCNNHTDPGRYWNWQYYLALVKADTTPPRILTMAPPPGTIGHKAYKPLVITFDKPMIQQQTNAALHITPPIQGTITWSNNYQTMTFTPNQFWNFSTTYTIVLDTTALSITGISIDGNGDGKGGDPFIAQFTTTGADITPPRIVSIYPLWGMGDVSIYTSMRIVFDEPVQWSSLAGRILLYDDSSRIVSVTEARSDTVNDFNYVTFRPAAPLRFHAGYAIKLGAGIKDLFGNATTNDEWIYFFTQNEFIPGIVVDSFESRAGWQQPMESTATMGADSAGTKFTISNERAYGGRYAGKLSYAFLYDSGGVVCEHNAGGFPIEGRSTIGAWIYGDASGNTLELWFSPGDTKIVIGPLVWFGWRYVNVFVRDVPGSSRSLNSIVVRQVPGAPKSGAIFIDDLQVNGLISKVESQPLVPERAYLNQNYPNPFNSSAIVSFGLPESAPVALKVYDVLGREVATLVSGKMAAGTHIVTFDASHLPSGVYFYRLEVNGATPFVSIKKLVLLR